MIDIHYDNFESELIGASMQTPVLLDIWAPWCGPCKQLGPVLEQLEQDYGGRFVLAKLNADEVPEIASQLSQLFGVRSIPFCVMFVQGQPVDGFVGALPQAQIQDFLDKYVAPASDDDLAPSAPAADAQADSETPGDPVAQLAQQLSAQPQNEELRLSLVRAHLARGELDEARSVFEPLAVLATGPVPQARVLAHALYLDAVSAARQARPADALQALLATQPRQFDARFELAQVHMAAGRFTQAMDELLEIIMRDKAWHDELARKTYVAILEVLSKPVEKPNKPAAGAGNPGSRDPAKDKPALEIAGATHVPAGDPVIDQYRRKLSMALF